MKVISGIILCAVMLWPAYSHAGGSGSVSVVLPIKAKLIRYSSLLHFSALDEDRDNRISKREFVTKAPSFHGVEEVFNKIDRDGDMIISHMELEQHKSLP